jgi:Family of unknown function (DUF5808)
MEMERLRRIFKLVAFGLLIAAVADQLRRPPEERTWEGTVVGFVPYDLRMPTFERARSRWWNPDDPRLFVPQVFGIGWTVNFARLVNLSRQD